MAESTLGHKAATGAIWASIDRFGAMGVSFIVNLVLARLLMPEDFGIIGMLAIFIAVSQTLIDSGFSTALIQKKNPTQTDFSTIFYWNIVLALLLYLCLFISAPYIANFYRTPLMCPVLRVIGISLLLCGINAVQLTRLRKTLSFKTIAASNLTSTFISGCIAIFLAYRGLGVWSLVVMQIAAAAINVLILACVTRWLPSCAFSLSSFKELFSFGGFILAANVLQTICQNFQGVIIGRKFSATQMGYFSQAYKLDQVTSYSLPQVIVQVMYPVYSSIQDDRKRLQNVLLMNIRVIAFVVFFLLGFLMLAAEPIILGLYGEKWITSVPYFQIFCVGGLFVCLQNINFYAVAAVGKSKDLFLWSFYKWGFLLAILFVGSFVGMYGILWGMVASSFNIFAVNSYLASKHVGLTVLSQIRALFPVSIILTASLLASFICSELTSAGMIISCSIYIIVYALGSWLFNKNAVSESIDIIKRIINRQ